MLNPVEDVARRGSRQSGVDSASYMRKNLESVPLHDRTLMFAPFGKHVADDWVDINERVDELVHELGKLEQV